MKLLNCIHCHDIFQISTKEKRVCRCKKSSAQFVSETKLEYSGPSRVLGISWMDYVASLKIQTKLDENKRSTPRFPWFEILEGRNIKKI